MGEGAITRMNTSAPGTMPRATITSHRFQYSLASTPWSTSITCFNPSQRVEPFRRSSSVMRTSVSKLRYAIQPCGLQGPGPIRQDFHLLTILVDGIHTKAPMPQHPIVMASQGCAAMQHGTRVAVSAAWYGPKAWG